MNVLDVKNLTIEFKSEQGFLPAVTDISFHLRKGEILALVGESGCGKSISCMSLSRLLPSPPARIPRGEVLLTKRDGTTEDVMKLSPRQLRKIRGGEIAYIFQEPSVSLNPVFRVGTQIAEAIELHRPDVTDVEGEVVNLLRQVGIPGPEERAKLYPHEMSGGMQQRVMIAMALASHPSILVADEPTTALDVTIQAQIFDLLRDVKEKISGSIMLITHDLGVIAEMVDYVVVMYAGRVVEKGTVTEIFKNPMHPYTIGLQKSKPVVGKEVDRLYSIPGNVPNPVNMPSTCYFKDRCNMKCNVCKNGYPPMVQVSPTHYVACYLALKEGLSNG